MQDLNMHRGISQKYFCNTQCLAIQSLV
ncbi:protein of unknown function [Pararobbsia alpina]